MRLSQVLGGGSVFELFNGWAQLVENTQDSRVPAGRLYAGVGWAASLDAWRAAIDSGLQAELWVMSAGFGLIPATAAILPYSATFSAGKPDSVSRVSRRVRSFNQQWWRLLSAWHYPGNRGPRRVAELAQTVDALMAIMSSTYVDASRDDMADAAKSTGSFVIISGGLPKAHPLEFYAPQFDKRLRESTRDGGGKLHVRPLVRASDMSLNARIAEHLFKRLGAAALDQHQVQSYLDAEMVHRPPPRHFSHRSPAHDSAVLQYIKEGLERDPSTTKTRLLRTWRDSGRSCEQQRFYNLFQVIRTELELDLEAD